MKNKQATQTLIADDSFMIVKIIKKALLSNQIKNYYFTEESIFTAADGMEAFGIMGQHKEIKLVITDINMPYLNGDEFVEILHDTGKLKDLYVVFVTSDTNLKLSPTLKNNILGTLYKPFTYNSFAKDLEILYREEKVKIQKIKEIKNFHIGQIKEVKKAVLEYIKQNKLPAIETQLLNILAEDFFKTDEIANEDISEITYAVLTLYLFEIKSKQTINLKKIICILKSFQKKNILKKHRFSFISGFESQITYVNSSPDLELKEILSELTTSIRDNISIALSQAKKFPKLRTQHFSMHFEYIVNELSKLDCTFKDEHLQKLILEQKEVEEFSQWIYKYLKQKKFKTDINKVSSSTVLAVELTKQLTRIYQRTSLLSHHYCGEIEFYIWSRAKASAEILNYLYINMNQTMANTPLFLLHKEQIDRAEYEEKYALLEKQNIFVLSNEAFIMKVFKDIDAKQFVKWDFLCFPSQSLFDAWIPHNVPDKIIIDYNFSDKVIKNGLAFLKLILKKYEVLPKMVATHQIYVLIDKNQFEEIKAYREKYNLIIIQKPLNVKSICETLLYN